MFERATPAGADFTAVPGHENQENHWKNIVEAKYDRLAPEHVPFLRNRNMLSILSFAHVLIGEPASTSPEHALAPRIGGAQQR
jgi:hypothetical protein